MTVPFLCLTLAFAFLYISKVPVGMAMARMPKGYDNRQPRDQQGELGGWVAARWRPTKTASRTSPSSRRRSWSPTSGMATPPGAPCSR